MIQKIKKRLNKWTGKNWLSLGELLWWSLLFSIVSIFYIYF